MNNALLRCLFGTRWLDHDGCLFCQAESDRLRDEFLEEVQRGIYDRDGYTPAERTRLGRKHAEARP